MTKRTKNIIFFAVVLPVVFIVSSVDVFLKQRIKSETMAIQNARGVITGHNSTNYGKDDEDGIHTRLITPFDLQPDSFLVENSETSTAFIHCHYCTNRVGSASVIMAYCTNITIYEASNGPVVEFSVKSEGAFKNEPTVTQSNGTWLVVFRKGL